MRLLCNKIYFRLIIRTIVVLLFTTLVSEAWANEEDQVWLPDRFDQALAADRVLDEEHLRVLSELSLILVDKTTRSGKRSRALQELNDKYRHVLAIPALLAVVRDPAESDDNLKSRSVGGLSAVNDRRVVTILIDLLLSSNANVSQKAWTQLWQLTLQNFCYDHRESLERREAQARRWSDWWNEHQESAEIHWDSALIIADYFEEIPCTE